MWDSGRWMHAHMARNQGRATANFQMVYGVAGQLKTNSQLRKAVLLYTARLHISRAF